MFAAVSAAASRECCWRGRADRLIGGMSMARRFSVLILALYGARRRRRRPAPPMPIRRTGSEGLKSSARLIAGARRRNGVFQAGVEIRARARRDHLLALSGRRGSAADALLQRIRQSGAGRISFPAPRRLQKGAARRSAMMARWSCRSTSSRSTGQACHPGAETELCGLRDDLRSRRSEPAPRAAARDAPPSPYAEAIAKAKELTPRRVDWPRARRRSDRHQREDLAPVPGAAGGPQTRSVHRAPGRLVVRRQGRRGRAGRERLLSRQSDATAARLGASVAARLTITGGRGPVETTIELPAPGG